MSMTSMAKVVCVCSFALLACSSNESFGGPSNECASLQGTYQGSYSVEGGDCPAGTEYEPTSVSVNVTITSGRFNLTAAGQSCSGALDACEISTLAGVCSGTVAIGAKQYANVSRVAFGAGGSLAVTGINKIPPKGKQCVMEVGFTGQKTSD